LPDTEGPFWHATPSDNWVRPEFAAFGRVGLEFLSQIPSDQDIGNVPDDWAHDTRKFHEEIAVRCAYAVIPTRRNAKPRKPMIAGAIIHDDAVNAQRYLAERCGDVGADTTAEARSKRRCIVRNYTANR